MTVVVQMLLMFANINVVWGGSLRSVALMSFAVHHIPDLILHSCCAQLILMHLLHLLVGWNKGYLWKAECGSWWFDWSFTCQYPIGLSLKWHCNFLSRYRLALTPSVNVLPLFSAVALTLSIKCSTWTSEWFSNCQPLVQQQRGSLVIRHALDLSIYHFSCIDSKYCRISFAPSSAVIFFRSLSLHVTPLVRCSTLISAAEILLSVCDVKKSCFTAVCQDWPQYSLVYDHFAFPG